MASSRVMTLLVTLLLVIVLGIYLLWLNLLSDLLILASRCCWRGLIWSVSGF